MLPFAAALRVEGAGGGGLEEARVLERSNGVINEATINGKVSTKGS